MGTDSARTKLTHSLLAIIAFSLATTWAQAVWPAQNGEKVMTYSAQHFVDLFREGTEFRTSDSVNALIISGGIEPRSLRILANELANGAPFARENIVRLLEKIGLQLDQERPEKYRVIRNRTIIRTLLVEGFAKRDSAADRAATILRKRVMPADLSSFDSLYIESLSQGKGDYLLLAAKAKTPKALPYVEKLTSQPYWRSTPDQIEKLNIARAALGNKVMEDEFLASTLQAERDAPPAPANDFYDVSGIRDGAVVAERLEVLGLIGTQRSLLLVCKFLRSQLKTFVPDGGERSIRYDALDALLYNFPDERVLSDPSSLDDWRAAEKFCETKIGAVYDGPTPDIRDRPYPSRLTPQPIGM